MKIWSLNSTVYCNKYPKIIIIGPQKTGSTALYTYLNLHPNLKSNNFIDETFEEPQFFTDRIYHNGINWYLNLFESNSTSITFFEKSANYFTDKNAPIRIKKLIKNVKLIFISINPIKRAYSWYQHMKFHNDTISIQYSFYDILTLNSKNDSTLKQMRHLRNRCLDPGIYSKHLKNWLKYFLAEQIIHIDGDALVKTPYECLNELQNKISVETQIDYKTILKYNNKKGFFCVNNRNSIKCLGKNKGRVYPPIDTNSANYLNKFFKDSNKRFYNLLKKYNYVIPSWLKKEF
jgi:hypothetical protein